MWPLDTMAIPSPNSPTGAVTRRYRELLWAHGERFVLLREYGAYTVRHYASGYELVGGHETPEESKRCALDELDKLGPDRLKRQVADLEILNTIDEGIDV